MRLRVGEAEVDRNDVEERRVRELRALLAEIVADVEDKLEPARARFIGADQRLVCAAVRVGRTSATSVRPDPPKSYSSTRTP